MARRSCNPGCTCGRHSRPAGSTVLKTGYRILSKQHGHPLASKQGALLEHRKVLYDLIGPGPHPCYWLDEYHCGRTELVWGGIGRDSLVVDHLDHNKLNNAPDNLVPSCTSCNAFRGKAGWLRCALRPVDIEAICALHACKRHTLTEIGALFGVSEVTTRRIVSGKWRADGTQIA